MGLLLQVLRLAWGLPPSVQLWERSWGPHATGRRVTEARDRAGCKEGPGSRARAPCRIGHRGPTGQKGAFLREAAKHHRTGRSSVCCPKCASRRNTWKDKHPDGRSFIQMASGLSHVPPHPLKMTWVLPPEHSPERRFRGGGDTGALTALPLPPPPAWSLPSPVLASPCSVGCVALVSSMGCVALVSSITSPPWPEPRSPYPCHPLALLGGPCFIPST